MNHRKGSYAFAIVTPRADFFVPISVLEDIHTRRRCKDSRNVRFHFPTAKFVSLMEWRPLRCDKAVRCDLDKPLSVVAHRSEHLGAAMRRNHARPQRFP